MDLGNCVPLDSSKSFAEVIKANRSEMFGEEVKRRILAGTFVLSSDAISDYFVQAQRLRTLLMREFQAVFKDGSIGTKLPSNDLF
jgi:aspartyl-tRNA(Asn)/glutamyl-tRNA(Gln) amidotransferase subunit A